MECNQVFFNDKFASGKDYHDDVFEEFVNKLIQLAESKANNALMFSLKELQRNIEIEEIPGHKKISQFLKAITPALKKAGISTLEIMKDLNGRYTIPFVQDSEIEMKTFQSSSIYPFLGKVPSIVTKSKDCHYLSRPHYTWPK